MKLRKGFSTVELALGIAIISITIVMVVNLFSFMFKVASKGIENTVASSIINRIFSEINNDVDTSGGLSIYHPLSGSHSANSKKVYTGSQIMNKNTYCFMIELSPFSLSSGDGKSESNFVKADVVVFYHTGIKSEFANNGIEETAQAHLSFFGDASTIEDAVASKGLRKDGTGFSFNRMSRIYCLVKASTASN